MKVYRLERCKVGPFIGQAPYYRRPASPRKDRRRRHVFSQLPRSDFNFMTKHAQATHNGYVFGTKSKELLKAYFSYNLKPYFKDGYRIKTYEVQDDLVLDMGYEVAFPRPESIDIY